MEPMYLSIQQEETGKQIKRLLLENGYTVKDIQCAMGFENPQAIYKWISGKSLPSLDNFIILSRLLHTSIEDILVIDGGIARLWEDIFMGRYFIGMHLYRHTSLWAYILWRYVNLYLNLNQQYNDIFFNLL